jgi:hypothetical protein
LIVQGTRFHRRSAGRDAIPSNRSCPDGYEFDKTVIRDLRWPNIGKTKNLLQAFYGTSADAICSFAES